MVSFTQRYRALDELPASPTATCCRASCCDLSWCSSTGFPRCFGESTPQHPHELKQRLDTLERLISNVADQQATLVAVVSSLSAYSAPQSPPKSGTYPAPYEKQSSLFLLPRRRPCGTRLHEKTGCSPLYRLSLVALTYTEFLCYCDDVIISRNLSNHCMRFISAKPVLPA